MFANNAFPTQFRPDPGPHIVDVKNVGKQNWYWQSRLSQYFAKKSPEISCFDGRRILDRYNIQGKYLCPTNNVHFELVCSDHKLQNYQIAIVNCTWTLCSICCRIFKKTWSYYMETSNLDQPHKTTQFQVGSISGLIKACWKSGNFMALQLTMLGHFKKQECRETFKKFGTLASVSCSFLKGQGWITTTSCCHL